MLFIIVINKKIIFFIVNDMKQNTKYGGYSEGSQIIKWFWEVIE